jgi:hypothetical protein
MSEAAAADARARFAMDDVVQRYEDLYSATLRQQPLASNH